MTKFSTTINRGQTGQEKYNNVYNNNKEQFIVNFT